MLKAASFLMHSDNFSKVRGYLLAHSKVILHDEVCSIKMARLQGADIAAFPAMTNKAIVEDPHIRARGFIAEWDQVDVGRIQFPGFPIHFSALDVEFRTCPGLGHDNAAVLAERLGLPATEVAALVDQGVLGNRPPQPPES